MNDIIRDEGMKVMEREISWRRKMGETLGQQLECVSGETRESMLEVVAKIRQSSAEMVLITDVDETIINSVRKHWDVYKRYFKRLQRILKKRAGDKYEEQIQSDYGYLRELKNPTYGEMILAGETHAAYREFGEAYKKINAQIVTSPNFNQNLELVEPDIAEWVKQINRKFPMVGALTSRPESLHKITRQQLQESIGFDLPVIARPENIVLERARDWKVLVLRELAAVSGKKIVMLDDQQGLIELIEKQKNPQVKGILMKGVWRGGSEEMRVSWEQLAGRLQELSVSW